MLSTDFTFDGVTSQSMGIFIVNINSSESSDPFMPSQSIKEEKRYNSHIPIFYGVEREPLEFELTLSLLDNEFTIAKRTELTKWLCRETYCEFISADNPDKIYNVISVSPIELITFGSLKGYFRVRFRCDAPWGWSALQLEEFDLSTSVTPTTITINNLSNAVKYLYPELEFTLVGDDTGITIVNLTNNNETFQFTNLAVGETIYVNNELKQIIGDAGMYRLSNFNKKWFRLVQSENEIQVTGKCLLSFRYKFPLLT